MAAIVWKGYLSFGLVSFPVRLYAAARGETVHFHMLHKKDMSRVRQVLYCAEEDKAIERSEVVKGYEYEKGQYVVIDPEDLKKIAPETADTMEILQFVKADEVDPLYFESSYYVAPDQKVSKPYLLFLRALEKSGYHAIAKLSMHTREHTVIVRPSDNGLVLHTMYYQDELNSDNAVKPSEKDTVNAKEMELAKRLIDALAGPFDPEQYRDTYRENVERLIEQKKKGEPITPTKSQKKAPVVDILTALKESLSNPPARREPHRADTAVSKKVAKKRRSAA